MPRFIYAGTHRDKPALTDGNATDSIVAFGLTFPRGLPVEVMDLRAAGKLAGNPFFRIAPEEPGLPAEAPEIGAALTPEPVNALLAEPPTIEPRRKRKGASA